MVVRVVSPQTAGVIRTPAQRLRVFVSSTLAEQRVAVTRAIEALRLMPVMFELGARPHPLKKLYRAHLSAIRHPHRAVLAALRLDRARH